MLVVMTARSSPGPDFRKRVDAEKRGETAGNVGEGIRDLHAPRGIHPWPKIVQQVQIRYHVGDETDEIN